MTLDETTGNQDDTTSEDPKETSSETPETFTKESETKAISDALSVAGRDAKAMETREKAVSAVLSKAEKIQTDIKVADDKRVEQKYQDDLTKAGDDPIARSKVELAQENRRLRGELGDSETKSEQKDDRILQLEQTEAVSTKERNARVIASKYEVDPEILKLTDGSVETMEVLAKQLTGKTTATLMPDSGKTIGGKARERIIEEYIKNPDDPKIKERYMELRASEGR